MMKPIQSLISKTPGLSNLYGIYHEIKCFREPSVYPYIHHYPPGHFYSPIPTLHDLSYKTMTAGRFNQEDSPDINFRQEEQLLLLDKFSTYYADLPFADQPSETVRYYYQNDYFRYSDAIILYSMLRHFQPQRIIEVGSGFSSAVILDTNDRFLSHSATVTFIEPYPDRLHQLLRDEDRTQHRIIGRKVQDVDLSLFQTLESGDLLFIDSSHVAKVGSDVQHIFSKILPVLKQGVIVHFHDIFFPFEYPDSWLKQGRAWNEAYLLRSFLQYNSAFPMLYFNSFMGEFHQEEIRQKMPLCLEDTGGSIWLQKV